MFRLGRLVVSLAAALAVGLIAACENDALGPSDAPVAVVGSTNALTGRLSESQLKALEVREKARIDLAAKASQRTYDSLKVEWDLILKQYSNGNTGRSGPIYCDPLSYTGEVKIIGPEGGEMSIGPHKLSIPRGALKYRTVITGEMPVSMAVTVRLSPHGLVFLKQPKLTLSYKHCMRPTDYRERVAYTDERLNPLEFPRSLDRTLDGLIDAWLNHFSRYAVMY